MKFKDLLAKIASISIVSSVISLGSMFVLGYIMEKDQFGDYSVIHSYYLLLINLIPFGTSMSFVVFLFRKSESDYRSLVGNGLLILMPLMSFILMLASTLIMNFYGENGINRTIIYLLLLSTANSACLTVIAYFRTKQEMRIYAFLFLTFHLLFSGSLLLSYTMFKSIEMMYMFTSIIMFLLMVIYVILLNLKLNFIATTKFSTSQLKKSILYGVPIVLSSMAMSFLITGDRILLSTLMNGDEISQYAVAALVSSTSLFLVNNFASAWGGFLAKEIPKMTNEEVVITFTRNQKKLWLVVPIMLLILPIQFTIFWLLYSELYEPAYLLILPLTLGYSLYGVAKYYVGYMNFYAKNYMVLSSVMVSIIFVVLSFILLQKLLSLQIMGVIVLTGFVFNLAFCFFYTKSLLTRIR